MLCPIIILHITIHDIVQQCIAHLHLIIIGISLQTVFELGGVTSDVFVITWI